MKKKGQIQSGETVVVIIIVIIMLVIGLVFVAGRKKNSITEETTTLNELKAKEIATVSSKLKELKCSDYGVMVNTCFDYHRLRAFSSVVSSNKQNSKDYYYSVLGNSKIELKIITSNPPENITIYDFNNSINKSSSPVFIPTLVLDSMNKKSYFAILEVRTYS
ncbi:MAG: hypothetical protein WC758_03110 [Candidatus Woesearchaeota archaeon]|jgi:hypothetical protein